MSIVLPASPLPQTATPRLLDFGADMVPPQGGAAQRLNRIGNRYAIEVVTPRLKPEPDGRLWASRLRQAKTQGAIFPFPEPGIPATDYGTPVVNGGGQAGSAISVRGFPPGALIREGKFFSIIHGGRRYLHSASGGDVTANGSGIAALTITPMLRISPLDAATCEFAAPMIEGFLSGNELAWQHVIARVQALTFTITEVQ